MLFSVGGGKGLAPIWESGVPPWMRPGEGDAGGTARPGMPAAAAPAAPWGMAGRAAMATDPAPAACAGTGTDMDADGGVAGECGRL